MNNVNAEHPLGKGEVVSSILTGSTTKAHSIGTFSAAEYFDSAVAGRTLREQHISKRGKSVASFPGCSQEDSMTHDLEALKKEHDRLSAIMQEASHNPELAGTRPKVVIAHRLLTDLIAANGGTPEQRAEVMRRLTEIHGK